MEKELLKKYMRKRGVGANTMAKRLKLSRLFLRLRLLGLMEFRLGEIQKIRDILGLSEAEVGEIFFGQKVS